MHLPQLKNQYGFFIILVEGHSLFRFYWFPLVPFFFQRFPPRITHHIKPSYLGRLLSVISCFRWPWQLWGQLVRHSVDGPSVWDWQMFFPMIRLRYGRWAEDTEAMGPSPHILSREHASASLLSNANFSPAWGRVCSTLHCHEPLLPFQMVSTLGSRHG